MPSLLTLFLTYLPPYLSNPLRIGPFHFQAEVRKWRPNLALVFLAFILCYSMFYYGCMFALIVLDFVIQYSAKRLAGKNVSEMTYSV